MKIFISSVIQGFKSERDAAATAVRALKHEVVRAEDFDAMPSSPRVACLAGVRTANAVVLILGARYGDIQPSGISATHEEFREACDAQLPIFAFVAAGDREDRQAKFATEVRDWLAGVYTGTYTSNDDLRDQIVGALHDFALSQAAGSVDVDDLAHRSVALLPKPQRDRFTPRLVVGTASAPRQAIIRPAILESSELQKDLHKLALFGRNPIFTPTSGATPAIDGHSLSLTQEDERYFSVSEDGSIVVALPLREAEESMLAIIGEEVVEKIVTSLLFASEVLERIDDRRRLSHVGLAARIDNANHRGWRTRAEQASQPKSGTMRLDGDVDTAAQLSPPHRPRAALSTQTQVLAEDLATLLRRSFG